LKGGGGGGIRVLGRRKFLRAQVGFFVFVQRSASDHMITRISAIEKSWDFFWAGDVGLENCE